MISRREWLLGSASAAVARGGRPAGVIVDTHIHLFDPARFPYHANASYRPPAETLDDYKAMVKATRLDHAVIVHPEPYQDDHRYLDYCFRNEPSPGFFKGTCLFDPLDPRTPERMAALAKQWPGRIVALRVHENRDPKLGPLKTGSIRDRDLNDPAMLTTWRAAQRLGIAVQMHLIPAYARKVGELAARAEGLTVVLDHMGRPASGSAVEYADLVALAKRPGIYLKFSGWSYASKEPHPHRDLAPLARRLFDAFGPDRMITGYLGNTAAAFEKSIEVLDTLLGFASGQDLEKIRGGTAKRLYRFG